MVYHWSLSGSKSPHVSRTLLSIQVDHNNAMIWMILILPLIYSFPPCLFFIFLGTIPKTSPIICITVTFMFHSFFSSLTRYMYWSFFFLSFWHDGPTEQQNVWIEKVFSLWSDLLERTGYFYLKAPWNFMSLIFLHHYCYNYGHYF